MLGNITEGNKETKLFSSGSLFSNSSLFNTGSSSLFSSKPLFNFNSFSNKESNFYKKDEEENKSDEESGDDNDLFKSDSPKYERPQESTVTEEGPFKKRFSKDLENIYLFSVSDKKFVSKGKGFISLEYAEIENNKIGVVVYR